MVELMCIASLSRRGQIRVVASDNGSPPLQATAIVYVTVRRNFYAPTWEQSAYTARILETQAAGVTFLTVKAADRDRQVRATCCQLATCPW